MPMLGNDDIFDDIPVDHRSCRLLGPTALVVQGLMGVLVILSLVYKRQKESPKRPWVILPHPADRSYDVSKQVIGQMFVHGVNVLISGVVAEVAAGNACVLYFLNILIDTTFGVAIIYLTLHSLTFFLKEKCGFKGFETGKYGSPPSLSYWARQLAVYLFALTTMKLIVLALFAATPGIFKAGEWLLSFLGTSDAAQVIFTMGVFPIIMNILQFWLIDSIVKAGAHSASVALPSHDVERVEDPDEEPLFRSSIDDDDDEPHRQDIEDPRPIPRSESRSKSRETRSSDENKSSPGTSTTAAASGSTTPKVAQAIAIHAYPPSLVSTSTSTSTSLVSSWNPSTRANSMSPHKHWRRSPPPPLTFEARSPAPVAVNSASPVVTLQPPLEEAHCPSDEVHNKKDWAVWDESSDWAGRVGEDEWTGNRIAGRKAALREVWRDHDRPSSVRIAS
ncbi:vacuolar membrane protein-domain-containing protein [Cytidiella melzeri]|nr:vacuolar membrane protein-domain-containing protein [Cytidiella melzeri]